MRINIFHMSAPVKLEFDKQVDFIKTQFNCDNAYFSMHKTLMRQKYRVGLQFYINKKTNHSSSIEHVLHILKVNANYLPYQIKIYGQIITIFMERLDQIPTIKRLLDDIASAKYSGLSLGTWNFILIKATITSDRVAKTRQIAANQLPYGKYRFKTAISQSYEVLEKVVVSPRFLNSKNQNLSWNWKSTRVLYLQETILDWAKDYEDSIKLTTKFPGIPTYDLHDLYSRGVFYVENGEVLTLLYMRFGEYLVPCTEYILPTQVEVP